MRKTLTVPVTEFAMIMKVKQILKKIYRKTPEERSTHEVQEMSLCIKMIIRQLVTENESLASPIQLCQNKQQQFYVTGTPVCNGQDSETER
jgi:hypothetical protein